MTSVRLIAAAVALVPMLAIADDVSIVRGRYLVTTAGCNDCHTPLVSGAIGRAVGIAGEHLSGTEMAGVLTRAMGEPVAFHAIPFMRYAQLGFPGAEDLANMFEFKRLFEAEYRASRPVAA